MLIYLTNGNDSSRPNNNNNRQWVTASFKILDCHNIELWRGGGATSYVFVIDVEP